MDNKRCLWLDHVKIGSAQRIKIGGEVVIVVEGETSLTAALLPLLAFLPGLFDCISGLIDSLGELFDGDVESGPFSGEFSHLFLEFLNVLCCSLQNGAFVLFSPSVQLACANEGNYNNTRTQGRSLQCFLYPR